MLSSTYTPLRFQLRHRWRYLPRLLRRDLYRWYWRHIELTTEAASGWLIRQPISFREFSTLPLLHVYTQFSGKSLMQPNELQCQGEEERLQEFLHLGSMRRRRDARSSTRLRRHPLRTSQELAGKPAQHSGPYLRSPYTTCCVRPLINGKGGRRGHDLSSSRRVSHSHPNIEYNILLLGC